VLGDLLGSVGVIVAAIVLITTGWAYADPIIGVAIGLFILPRTFVLLRGTLRILLEVAPPEISVDDVTKAVAALEGVAAVHDLHVWTITSGIESASGHVVLTDGADYDATLQRILGMLKERFGIEHATIQCEPQAFSEPAGGSPI
jgi:cobalt-zinc-cadmium efflux system protein